jgi:hypothetical protein
MALKRESFTDGISTIERTVLLRRRRMSRADQREAQRVMRTTWGKWGFEHRVKAAEAFWRSVSADPTAKPLTLAWYRERILSAIPYLRSVVALGASAESVTTVNLEYWILTAMELGRLTEEAVVRFNLGDSIRRDRKNIARLHTGSPVGLAKIRQQKADRQTALRAAVRDVDRRLPEQSRRWVAAWLHRHDPAYEDVSIETLTKRIARLTPPTKRSASDKK